MNEDTLLRLLRRQGYDLSDDIFVEDEDEEEAFNLFVNVEDLGFPYYIVSSHNDEHFMVLDKYFHFVWCSSSDKKNAIKKLWRVYRKRPDVEDVYEALRVMSDNGDIFAQTSIRKGQDPEGYKSSYQASRKQDPPHDYRWLYNHLVEEGECSTFAPGCTFYLVDEDEIQNYLDDVRLRKKIKKMICRVRSRAIKDLINKYRRG